MEPAAAAQVEVELMAPATTTQKELNEQNGPIEERPVSDRARMRENQNFSSPRGRRRA